LTAATTTARRTPFPAAFNAAPATRVDVSTGTFNSSSEAVADRIMIEDDLRFVGYPSHAPLAGFQREDAVVGFRHLPDDVDVVVFG
jgi:hypothetical protein